MRQHGRVEREVVRELVGWLWTVVVWGGGRV